MTRLPLAAFIEADVRLLRPDEGGRRSGIWSGYRCNCWIGHVHAGRRVYNDATFYLVGVEEVPPGGSARVRVLPHDPDEWRELTIGSTFELCEGERVVAHAVVVQLFPAP